MIEIEKTFEGQRVDEQFEKLFRRSFIIMVKFYLIVIVFAILTYFLAKIKVLFYIMLIVDLILLLFTINKTIMWYYSYFIITNQRIRCIQRNGLFNQSIVDISLDTISSIQYQERGLGSVLFNYGNLSINSSSGDLFVSRAKDARQIYDLIQNLLNTESDYNEE